MIFDMLAHIGVFFVSFGHSKSFGLLKQTKRNLQSGVIVGIMDKLCGFLLCFLRVLTDTQNHGLSGLRAGQVSSRIPPRPVNFYNTCGPDFLRPDGLEIIGPADAGP